MDNKEQKEKLRIVETLAKRKQKKDEEQDEPGEEAAMLEEANGDVENETEKDEEIELSASLTENTYSIIYVANPKSWAFYFGIASFLFQIALPLLALSGLLDVGSNNFFKAPADVTRWVRGAGYLTLSLSVPLFKDLLDSIETIHEGYHPFVMKQTPHATFKKWALSCALQLLAGLVFLFVIFVLIVQSTTVIGMLLNFAALGFITEIDDVAFALAERGYFSNSIKQACFDVREHKTPNTKGPWLRRLALIFFVTLVVAGYTVIFSFQRQGKFLCTRMEVQFGDSFWPELPLFSGVYFVEKRKRENRRLVYEDEDTDGQTAIFRYCFSETAFVFGPFNNSQDFESFDDYYDVICDPTQYYAKSPNTESFNLLEARATDWSIVGSKYNSLTNSVDHLIMQCLDCGKGNCNQPEGGSCGQDSKCICNEDFFGNQCQFNERQICDVVEFDHRYDLFPVPGNKVFPSRFELVRDEEGSVLFYHGKAAYAYVYTEGDGRYGHLDILVYLGRRYYFLEGNWLDLLKNETLDSPAPARFLEYLKKNLQPGYDYKPGITFPLFVSEPLDVGSSKDKPTPADIGWFYAAQDDFNTSLAVGAPISTRLLCDRCNENEQQFCEYGGRCDNDKEVCVCLDGYVGSRCESYVG